MNFKISVGVIIRINVYISVRIYVYINIKEIIALEDYSLQHKKAWEFTAIAKKQLKYGLTNDIVVDHIKQV